MRLQGSHFADTAQVALGLAEPSLQKRLDQVPGYTRPHGPAAHADNVHVVVLNPLSGREVVVHQRGTHSWYLVCADRRAHAAAADSHAAFYLALGHGPGERDDKIGLVVALIQGIGAEIDYLMSGAAELRDQLFFQTKPTMIRGNSQTHVILLVCIRRPEDLLPRSQPAAELAGAEPARRELKHHRRASDGAFQPSHFQSQPKVPAGRD